VARPAQNCAFGFSARHQVKLTTKIIERYGFKLQFEFDVISADARPAW
jgi:hypothetical protein